MKYTNSTNDWSKCQSVPWYVSSASILFTLAGVMVTAELTDT